MSSHTAVSQNNKAQYYGKIGVLTVIAILISSVLSQMVASSGSTLINTLMKAYPEHADLVPQTIALPSLMMIPPLFLLGPLSRVVSKKYIMMGATLLFFIGGFGPFFFDNLHIYLVGRALMGIATGFMMPIPASLVGLFFEGKKETAMMGAINATACVAGVSFAAVFGILAVSNWRNSFWMYLILLVILVFQYLFIPKVPPEKQDVTMPKVDEHGNPIRFPVAVVLIIIGFFIWRCFVTSYLYLISPIIESDLIGGTPAHSGMAISVMQTASFLLSLIFIPVYNKIKIWLLPIILFFSGLTFAALAKATTLPGVFVGVLSFATSMTFMLPFLWKQMAFIPPRCWITWSLAFLNVAMYAGQFAAPYVMKFVQGIVGEGSPFLMTYAIVIWVLTVVGLIIAFYAKDYYAREEEVSVQTAG